MPTAGERCLCSTNPKGTLSLVCPKSSLPAALGSPSIDQLLRVLSGSKCSLAEMLKIRHFGKKQSLSGSEHSGRVCQPSCCQVGKKCFPGGLGASSFLAAMARPLCAPCRMRVLLQAWSGRIQLCDCLPGASSCPPEEQEGFISLTCACHPCPADFWGWHLEKRVWRWTWCTASPLQAGSDSQGVNSRRL